jgi:kinesin family protein C2/C3
VYADASPLVTSVLDGYNVCIFAYGQTGTGKTLNRGLNYRTLEELFKIAEERKESVTYGLSVSVLEVYNKQIRDLLSTSPSKKYETLFFGPVFRLQYYQLLTFISSC